MEIERCFEVFDKIDQEMSKVIIGQKELTWSLIIGLIAPVPYSPKGRYKTGCGHVMLDARPGTGKTTAAEVFGAIIANAKFSRIQFTPDTMPADITGTRIFIQQTGKFTIEKGPIFANIVLADELNRGNPRTKSALLEGMQERKVTITGQDESFELPFPFFVIATQNPVEQEGVYVNVEAEKDRFMFKIVLSKLSHKERAKITGQDFAGIELKPVVDIQEIIEIREIIREKVFPDSDILASIRRGEKDLTKIQEYIIRLIEATNPKISKVKMVLDYVEEGIGSKSEEVFTKDYLEADIASDRCGQHFLAAGKAQAFFNHRMYVTPDDIKRVAHPIMRHRLTLNNKALAYAMKNHELEVDMADRIISSILNEVPIP